MSARTSPTLLSHLSPWNTMFHAEQCGRLALTSSWWISSLNVIYRLVQKTHFVFHVQMSVFTFMFYVSSQWLASVKKMEKKDLWAKISCSTSWNRWYAWYCPSLDLFDTASICMCALLTCFSIDFCYFNQAEKIWVSGLLTELPTQLVSGLLVAASDVKGWPCCLCVLGSLAGSQAAAIVARAAAEQQRWWGWEKVEGKTVKALRPNPSINQLSTAPQQSLLLS